MPCSGEFVSFVFRRLLNWFILIFLFKFSPLRLLRRLASALKEKTVELERRSSISEERARSEVAERAARAREEADAAHLRATRISQDAGDRIVDNYPLVSCCMSLRFFVQ